MSEPMSPREILARLEGHRPTEGEDVVGSLTPETDQEKAFRWALEDFEGEVADYLEDPRDETKLDDARERVFNLFRKKANG